MGIEIIVMLIKMIIQFLVNGGLVNVSYVDVRGLNVKIVIKTNQGCSKGGNTCIVEGTL